MIKKIISLYNKFYENYEPFGGKGIVFIHVPKCGGTSVAHSIKVKSLFSYFDLNNTATIRCAKFFNDIDDHIENFHLVNELRSELLMYEVFKGTRFITGHFNFSNKVFNETSGDYDYITVLREPVQRFISKYHYNDIKIPIADYLNTKRAQGWGREYVNRFLGDDLSLPISEKIEIAKDNLEKFSIVGQLGNLDKFKRKFRNKYDRKLNITELNVGDYGEIEESVIGELKKICEPDIELFNSVVN